MAQYNMKTLTVDAATNALRSLNIVAAAVMLVTLLMRYRYSYIERYI